MSQPSTTENKKAFREQWRKSSGPLIVEQFPKKKETKQEMFERYNLKRAYEKGLPPVTWEEFLEEHIYYMMDTVY